MIALPDCRLTVIPAGSPVDHPTELLGSAEMRRLVDTLRTHFDRLLFDTPPAAPLADVGVLAPLADGVLLVDSGVAQMSDKVVEAGRFAENSAKRRGIAYASAATAVSRFSARTQRERELATLRVIGFTRGEISYVLLGEFALLAVIAVPFGLAAGYGFVERDDGGEREVDEERLVGLVEQGGNGGHEHEDEGNKRPHVVLSLRKQPQRHE